ncbi:hypothetical protein UFOVP236_34 [uncultured Caudovirales phage]|uniref:Uncharacterized protein n=1 Tax=uncultured Caudovirales phage TaxID=2100421 RepID=A0A6J7WU51_9CAUD|nr:hypothetical protein UFOVP236_34 [uncultured Caudovirales phage]
MFNIVVALCGALGGWVLKVIWDAIKELQGELRDVDKRMHEDFVRRDDFKDAIREIKEDMRAGFDKVDSTLGLLFKKLEAKEDK